MAADRIVKMFVASTARLQLVECSAILVRSTGWYKRIQQTVERAECLTESVKMSATQLGHPVVEEEDVPDGN